MVQSKSNPAKNHLPLFLKSHDSKSPSVPMQSVKWNAARGAWGERGGIRSQEASAGGWGGG